LDDKFHAEFLTDFPEQGVKQWWGGDSKFMRQYRENSIGIRPKLLLMYNRKLHYALMIGAKIDDFG